MSHEHRVALAIAFRQRGKSSLTEAELRQVMSFELNWYPPAEARLAIEEAKRLGLVTESGGLLTPSFDVKTVEAPLDFRPQRAGGGAATTVRDRIGAMLGDGGPSPLELSEEIASLERRTRGLHSRDVLALFVLARRGVDVTALAAELADETLGPMPSAAR